MADPITEEADSPHCVKGIDASQKRASGRKEKRKCAKKQKRKQKRRESALTEMEEEEARLNDPEEQLRLKLAEQEEMERMERERKEFEERERLWLEAAAAREAEEEAQRKLVEESQKNKEQNEELVEDDDWEYADEGPAEIIWQGNEIIVKKKRVKVARKNANQEQGEEDDDRPTSNPLPPQSVAFAAYKSSATVSAQEVFASVVQQTPNFGTEQDKAHCPFHIKTGACRFGSHCSRVHFHPDKSCTLLVKNMYNGPGIAWEQDEGLEFIVTRPFSIWCSVGGVLLVMHTDEEVERYYEEFYEDVHTEFLKFGEIVNFKVCRNGSFHLRGNVYVHYKALESAVLAYASLNGRYFAGKQITCEFVGVTRWKVAICGEYMKSRLKTCSRGSACNFIHCFRNPGGDYEWADWDNPPPKYWVKKMTALFGPSKEMESERHIELEDQKQPRHSSRKRTDRYHHRRSRSGEDSWNSDGDYSDENSGHKRSFISSRMRQSRGKRRKRSLNVKDEQSEGKSESDRVKQRSHSHSSSRAYSDDNRDHPSSHSKARFSSRKGLRSPIGDGNSEDECNSDDHLPQKKHRTYDHESGGENHCANQKQYRGQSKGCSGRWRKETQSSYENEKIDERYNNSDHERYQQKDKSCDRSSDSDYSGANNGHHDGRLNSRLGLTARGGKTDFREVFEKVEQECKSEKLEVYGGKHKSPGNSHRSDCIGESRDWHHRHSRKGDGGSNWKKDPSFLDEHKKTEEKDDSRYCKRYSSSYRSHDCDLGGDYSDASESRHCSHSKGRAHATRQQKRKTASPSESAQCEERYRWNHGTGSSLHHAFDDRYHPGVLEGNDEDAFNSKSVTIKKWIEKLVEVWRSREIGTEIRELGVVVAIEEEYSIEEESDILCDIRD
ncbi:hypothetical protein ACLOJK_014165 [Asimina triloba]